MLTGLRIKEFGPFDAVAVEFGPGLNVVSGAAIVSGEARGGGA